MIARPVFPWARTVVSGATSPTNRASVSAAKPASAGEGWIVRLYTLTEPGEPVFVRVPGRQLRAAWLCDARERDIEPLKLADGAAHLTMPGTIASVRLILEP